MTKEQLMQQNRDLRSQVEQLMQQVETLRAQVLEAERRLCEVTPETSPAFLNLQKALEDQKILTAAERHAKETEYSRAERYKNWCRDEAQRREKAERELEQMKLSLTGTEPAALPGAKQGRTGRPVKIDDSSRQQALKLRAAGYSIRQIAKALNISVGSVARLTAAANQGQPRPAGTDY